MEDLSSGFSRKHRYLDISGWMKLELDGFKELLYFSPENL
jgi:hypothetical protein